MTSPIASPRYIPGIVLLLVISACRRHDGAPAVAVGDLIREFDRAEKRPAAAFQIAAHSIDGITYPALVAAVPSRFTCPVRLPRHGRFHAYVTLADPPPGAAASPARVRVGISDGRIYEGLSSVILAPGDQRWIDIGADLSGYAGWQWSLFYRPDRLNWRLTLGADSLGGPATAIWGQPEILTDTRSAREYLARPR